MRIALDYDKTYSRHPALWDGFIKLCRSFDVDIRGVTARSPVIDRTAELVRFESMLPVFYTNGAAKHWFCEHFTGGWVPDVWVDDKVINILHNSATSPEDLAKWREERGEGPSFPDYRRLAGGE